MSGMNVLSLFLMIVAARQWSEGEEGRREEARRQAEGPHHEGGAHSSRVDHCGWRGREAELLRSHSRTFFLDSLVQIFAPGNPGHVQT